MTLIIGIEGITYSPNCFIMPLEQCIGLAIHL